MSITKHAQPTSGIFKHLKYCSQHDARLFLLTPFPRGTLFRRHHHSTTHQQRLALFHRNSHQYPTFTSTEPRRREGLGTLLSLNHARHPVNKATAHQSLQLCFAIDFYALGTIQQRKEADL
eukprot:scaffold244_cov172-Amphora_coffeaeformis.AAC.67